MTTIDRASLAEFNAGIARSRRDYNAHPVSACIYRDCPNLADNAYMCATHRAAGQSTVERSQARRAS